MAGTFAMVDLPSEHPTEQDHDVAADWFAKRERGADPATEADFRRWIASSPAHRIAYREAEATWHAGAPLGATSTGDSRSLGLAPFYMRRKIQAGAAGFSLIALVGIGLSALPGGRFSGSIITTAQAQSFETAVGEIKTIALADGSRVTLDTNSKVEVDVSPQHRRVTLERGRARFAVVGRGLPPFTVQARPSTITAEGAVFDIAKSDGKAQVRVLMGAVRVRSDVSAPAAALTVLVGGQRATIGFSVSASSEPVSDPDWPSGMVVLKAAPLADALASINRYNRVQLRLDAPTLAQVRISGGFRAKEPRGFAAAVAALHGLQVTNPSADLITLTSAHKGPSPK